MKKIILAAFLAAASALKCEADNSFAIGTNMVSISFSANVNSQSDKDFISPELAKVFAFAKNINAAFSTTSVPEEFELEYYKAPEPFPSFLDRSNISLSCSNGMFTVELGEQLAAKFLAAKEFAQTNAVLLSQFDNIVTIFNNGSVTNMSVAAKKEIFWMPKSDRISDSEMSEIIHMISSRLKLHYPSILNYEENVELEEHVGGDIADVFAFIVGTDRSNGDFIQTCCIVKIGDKIKLFAF
jgi:hypothetical protein